MTVTTADPGTARRAELADFLRARRARLSPAEMGLPDGGRRRTPGLRREELAQLAGVGVTWYTWLEQGRAINVSTQVLDAVARALRLDPAEHQHLYRLAGGPTPPHLPRVDDATVPEQVRAVVAAMHPIGAMLVNERFDILWWNRTWETMVRTLYSAPCGHYNLLWCCFTDAEIRGRVENWESEAPRLVAAFRSAYVENLHDPQWRAFVQDLCARSPEFAQLWERHDVATAAAGHRVLRHPTAGRLAFSTVSLDVEDMPGCRIMACVPVDDHTRTAVLNLVEKDGH
ncbi:helix-turn-helix transcriptional regulator [Actinoplanes sp. NPDC049596]|uniref:helix-turn-helix transcriptional regulator n=1 Tax=unclassified Actinoplanes TaxID=2626549 RepID=UPI00343CAF05